MATETTELSAPSITDVRRSNYMAALSLAEQIMSETTVMPTDFKVTVYSFAPNDPEISFYFHRDVASLQQFAGERGLTVSVEPRETGSVYHEAAGQAVRGVRVTAWSLISNDEAAVAA